MNKRFFLTIGLVFASIFILNGCARQPPADTQPPIEANQGKLLFEFAVFGDNKHLGPVFTQIIDKINASNVAFVVGLGDHTSGKNRREFVDFTNYMNEHLQKPYYVAVGDNDLTVNAVGARDANDFESIMPNPRNHFFEFAGVNFIILDGSRPDTGFAAKDLDWLEDNLATHADEQVFVFTHTPPQTPYNDLLYEPNEARDASEARFVELAQKYNVDRVFCGHFHGHLEYFLGTDNPVPVTVSGGGGAEAPFGLDNYFHYLEVSVYERGHEVKVIEI